MLLRVGIVLMTLALAFTSVVTLVAVYDEPMERAVAAKEPEPSVDGAKADKPAAQTAAPAGPPRRVRRKKKARR